MNSSAYFSIVGSYTSLLENVVCKRLESLVASDGGAGLSLRSEGKVDILKLNERFCVVKSEGDLGSELLLRFDEVRDLLTALVHLAKIVESVVKVTKSRIVKSAGNLLTVTRDEGDGVSLVDEGDGLLDLLLLDVKLLCESL